MKNTKKSPSQKPAISRVLLIDNSQTFRDGLLTAIEQASGLEVVGEADTATKVYENGFPLEADVAVINIDLPDQSGFKVSQWLAKRQPHMSLLLLCNWDWDVYLVGAKTACAAGVLFRMMPTPELVQSIKQATAGQIYSSGQLARMENWEQAIGERLRQLSHREWQVLWLVASGSSKHEIARKLELKENTAEKHVNSILQKLEVHSRGMLLSLVLTYHLDVLGRWDDIRNPLNNS